ncbi:hypothetical protein FRC12_022360 [Ceratobasidium sp. 428]|nr:hypothetical protein FRC12_022360 [Ceratobasidium sp. 428]
MHRKGGGGGVPIIGKLPHWTFNAEMSKWHSPSCLRPPPCRITNASTSTKRKRSVKLLAFQKKEQMKQEIQLLQTDLQERDEHIARLEEDMETLRQQLEDHGGEDQDHHADSDAPSKAEIKLMKKAVRGWISRAPRIMG